MKRKGIFKYLMVLLAIAIYSCSSDSDGGGDGGGDGGSDITSITISASETTINLGQTVTITVTGNEGTNVTSSATISVNGSAISGSSYTPTEAGTYTINAAYESLTSNDITVTANDTTVISIRVVSDSDTIKVGDTATFSVFGTDAGGTDYTMTGSATISVDGTVIDGNRFMAVASGTKSITATAGDLTSDTFDLAVNEVTAPASYEQKSVIEDFTGTWCGWCPRVSYALELVEADTDKVFAIAVHNGDPMANSFTSQIETHYGITGFPTAYLHRSVEWTYPEPSNVSQATGYASGSNSAGVSVNSLLKGNQLQVFASAGFGTTISGAKLIVYVLEDGIVRDQTNYTSYYGGVSTIDDFVHNHVMTHSFTNALGDVIPASGSMANSTYDQVFTVDITTTEITNGPNTSIVAMLVNADGSLINAQYSKVNIDKDFD